MRQLHCENQVTLLGNREEIAVVKRGVLVVGLGLLAVLLVVGLMYFPFQGFMIPDVPAGDASAAMTLEGSLGAGYVLQTEFISGRYAIPFLASILIAGIILLWVLRTDSGEHSRP